MEKDIGKIPKGEYNGTITEIVVGIKEYNGKTGIDIREFTKSETYTGPTKKGLRIPVEKFDEFKTIINSIQPEDLRPKEQEALPEKSEEKKEENSSVAEDGTI